MNRPISSYELAQQKAADQRQAEYDRKHTAEPTKEEKAEAIRMYLATVNGCDVHYKHQLTPMLYTSGVKCVADVAGAYWLIDAVCSYQGSRKIRGNPRLCEFQLWTLTVRPDNTARLACYEDSGMEPAIVQQIEYCDFPLDKFRLYVENRTILLPEER